jgi:hypothetical protein
LGVSRGCRCPLSQVDRSIGETDSRGMGTLAEIEAAAGSLPPEEQNQLLVFLAARLRGQTNDPPPPRRFTKEQISGWIAEDEADMRRFQKGE